MLDPKGKLNRLANVGGPMTWKQAYEQMKATAEKAAAQCEQWAAIAAELRDENATLVKQFDAAVSVYQEEVERLRTDLEAARTLLNSRPYWPDQDRAGAASAAERGAHDSAGTSSVDPHTSDWPGFGYDPGVRDGDGDW